MQPDFRHPFAVRPIGFSQNETTVIDSMLAGQELAKYRYFCLHKDNLQDPDLFLVNTDDDRALDALAQLNPGEVRPALLIGDAQADSPFPFVNRPIRLAELMDALDSLMDRRNAALARLEAAAMVTVPERRRRNRLPSDEQNQQTWLRLRRPVPEGGVVVVDKNDLLANFVTEALVRQNVDVSWTDSEPAAISECLQRSVALVIINTSTPNVEPYRLCEALKAGVSEHVRVMFLVGRNFEYNPLKAQLSGCDGFLNKPVTSRSLVSVLKKFVPEAS